MDKEACCSLAEDLKAKIVNEINAKMDIKLKELTNNHINTITNKLNRIEEQNNKIEK